MRKRCIQQFVLTAERNVQSLSSLTEVGQYTVANVILNTDHKEDTRITESIELLLTYTEFS